MRCAIEVQNGMIERNAGVPPERRIEFRVGIHLGDVVEESDGDLMGDGVNIAARLEGIAKPGAICLSEDAYRQVRGGSIWRSPISARPSSRTSPSRSGSIRCKSASPRRRSRRARAAKPPAPKRRSWLAPLAAGIAALLIVIAGGAWYFLAANRPRPSPRTRRRRAARLSIVVLPFANLSGDPAQDYLADALTEELTTALARIRDSFVIARNTAFTYKGKPVDAKAIGKDLGVRYVLEGSVQPSGDQVRVNAQLIDADSGAHLWADQFDTPRADLLQTQDEIVTHLARAMDIQLTEAEAARLKRTPAANPDAEDLALQCHAGVQKADISARKRTRVTVSANRRSPRSQQCPRPDLFVHQVLVAGHDRPQRRPRGRPQAGGRIGVESARPRSKLRQRSLRKGRHTLASRGASTKRSRRTNARSPWTRPWWTPMRAWASTTCTSGNLKRASNISTRRFG